MDLTNSEKLTNNVKEVADNLVLKIRKDFIRMATLQLLCSSAGASVAALINMNQQDVDSAALIAAKIWDKTSFQ
jgi:hypothetical protein